jgi:hypothetical protein
MELHANMAPEDRPVFEASAFQLFEFLKRKGFSGRRHSDLALAINFRLAALARLVQGDHMKGWTLLGQEEGLIHLHADVLKVAAREPLIENPDSTVAFDVSSFTHRILQIAQAKGRA